jgi:hypothetical protein
MDRDSTEAGISKRAEVFQKMSKRLAIFTIAIVAAFMWSGVSRAQTASPGQSGQAAGQTGQAGQTGDDKWKSEKWNTPPAPAAYWEKLKSAPAPKRDLSGMWDAGGLDRGIQPNGAYEHPDDPEHLGHDVPYTALGKEARAKNKPGSGVSGQFPVAEVNDPADYCDPPGMPRNDLFEFRTVEIFQSTKQVAILNQKNDTWRIIWTDGRELPEDAAPRWNGYAVGKWVDDYTFVANYIGMDARTWLDNVGRPHSDALKVEERWHRANADTVELTVTIDDPKFYTQPWKALDRFILHRLPDSYDISELICSATETAEYNKLVGKPVDPTPADNTSK